VIGQSVYTTNLWYRIHAVDMCSYTPTYADQLTLKKQMHDQQISNQRRTHTVRFLCSFAVTIANNIEACAYLSVAYLHDTFPWSLPTNLSYSPAATAASSTRAVDFSSGPARFTDFIPFGF